MVKDKLNVFSNNKGRWIAGIGIVVVLVMGFGSLFYVWNVLPKKSEPDAAAFDPIKFHTEAVQTILRREGYPKPYEALRDLTRTNEAITSETLARFIDGLDVSVEVKAELKQITPETYTGITPRIEQA